MQKTIPKLLIAAVLTAMMVTMGEAQPSPPRTLRAFPSDDFLFAYLNHVARAHKAAAPPPCGSVLMLVDSTRTEGDAIVNGTLRQHLGAEPSSALSNGTVSLGPLNGQVFTGADGRYEIRVPAESLGSERTVSVQFRRLGFEARRYALPLARGRRVQLDVSLCAAAMQLNSMVVIPSPAATITNVQEAGVDEGDIVKQMGEHLIILRRGRLYSVRLRTPSSARGLQLVDVADAFGPGIDPEGAWYDELLAWGDKLVVVGYAYSRHRTEIGIFQLRPSGRLTHIDTYHLTGDDYYSTRNYASRLVGQRLVFYAPISLRYDEKGQFSSSLPELRRWRAGSDTGVFERTLPATRVFRPAGPDAPLSIDALHSVTTCDLAAARFTCQSTVVLGAAHRVFYATRTAAYLWMSAYRDSRPEMAAGQQTSVPAILVRIPFDNGAPTAIGVQGSPIDQFSLLERRDRLYAVVRADGATEYVEGTYDSRAPLSLLRLPLRGLTDGSDMAPVAAYQSLPAPLSATVFPADTAAAGPRALRVRFVGDHVLYGEGRSWGTPPARPGLLQVVPLSSGAATAVRIPHGVDRIEALGDDALIVGSDSSDLQLSAVRLGGTPRLAYGFRLPNASEGEMRSHGFFYRPTAGASGVGLLGIPVRPQGAPGYSHLFESSSAVLFLRKTRDRFTQVGLLRPIPASAVDDACRTSCVDWYGNSRPIFIGQRVMALLGHELVDGREVGGVLRETSRALLTPRQHSR
ncbi:beta-propeller domain-containing protein [Gemmatimonas sp.]|uniref:beta-propeller domain-containing protein n=1 Tax=Gemmatimonas sp. TaxID=1962908 RepID=UPI003DA56B83